ncbi:MAG: transcription elongation factor GreB [Limnobacter sp.]|uniref:transcription elongation factor GreB n=1 Tax=Limnobacter sp. TaxID=2003368 RepID=UPI00391A8F69
MSKAFTRESESDQDDEGQDGVPALPQGLKNYMTPSGYKRLRDELIHLVKVERPEVVSVVSWAASNGDRSENGDYLYGKKRLREIDRRIRFLTKRTEIAEVVDPATQQGLESVFFGATVTYLNGKGDELTVKIVGVDEVNPAQAHISWISPVARALLKAKVGDVVVVQTPAGPDELEVLAIDYLID